MTVALETDEREVELLDRGVLRALRSGAARDPGTAGRRARCWSRNSPRRSRSRCRRCRGTSRCWCAPGWCEQERIRPDQPLQPGSPGRSSRPRSGSTATANTGRRSSTCWPRHAGIGKERGRSGRGRNRRSLQRRKPSDAITAIIRSCRATRGSRRARQLLAQEKEFTRAARRAERSSGGPCRGCGSRSRMCSRGRKGKADASADLFGGRSQLDRLPLHVRPGVGGRLQELLVLGRQFQRHRRASRSSAT